MYCSNHNYTRKRNFINNIERGFKPQNALYLQQNKVVSTISISLGFIFFYGIYFHNEFMKTCISNIIK